MGSLPENIDLFYVYDKLLETSGSDEERQTSSPQSNHLLLPETFRNFEGDEIEDEAPFYTDNESPLKPGMKLGYALTLVRKIAANMAEKYGVIKHVTPPTPKYEILAIGKAKSTPDALFEVAVKLKNLETGVEEVWKWNSEIWERFETTR